jgi:SAM-dependent methyltransferase
MLRTLADHRDPASLAARLRRRRFSLFEGLLARLAGPLRILDVGGLPGFWRVIRFDRAGVSITLLNVDPVSEPTGFRCVKGDARDMRMFRDGEFDVVFSNSVIEHVGAFADQQAMAAEVRRVGKRYFVQTPNKYFPIEPHFLVPGFQFLPDHVRAGWLARRRVGWYPRAESYEAALAEVTRIRLLSRSQFQRLFPEGRLHRERFLGLTKSFVVYDGWE